MKIIVAIAVFIGFWGAAAAQNTSTEKNSTSAKTINTANGYEIKVTLLPYKNCWMYLGSYYGKNKILADSAWFNERSEATFKGETKLPGGIYFFVSPAHSLLFEILMDEGQHFTVNADSAHLENLTITGSPENSLFAQYTQFLTKVGPQLNALQGQLKTSAHNATDSSNIQSQI